VLEKWRAGKIKDENVSSWAVRLENPLKEQLNPVRDFSNRVNTGGPFPAKGHFYPN
jgi:hypothetical protein